MTKRNTIVYCSVVPYGYPPHHRVFFTKKLSKKHDIFFVSLPTTKSFVSSKFPYRFIANIPLLALGKKNFFVWDNYPKNKLMYLILNCLLWFKKLILRHKIILITTSAYYDPIYSKIPSDLKIFDCPDIHKGEFDLRKKFIEEMDIVLTNTRYMQKLLSALNNNVQIVSSGYIESPQIYDQKSENKKSVLFYGGISQRIDYRLVLYAVKNLPDYTFYFAGEVYLNKYYQEDADVERGKLWGKIVSCKNVKYLSIKKISKLPKCGAGIIPYIRSDIFNLYSNPIKIYDYLSMGVPTICPELKISKELKEKIPIYTYKTKEDFVNTIKKVCESASSVKISKAKTLKILKNNGIQKKLSDVLSIPGLQNIRGNQTEVSS